MRLLPPHADYMDSGLPGIGHVPSHWIVTRMDKYLEYVKRQLPTEKLAGQEVFHYSIPVVQETGTGALEDGSAISSDKLQVDRDVILVSKLNPRKATVCRAAPQSELTICSTEFVPLAVHDMDMSFALYLVSTDVYRQRLESLVESATRSHQRVTPADIYRFWWAIPGLREQRQIVRFLDRETAKIDALIAKQEQLIATLREDRTATITHAVTKGLDREVELVESGVEWIGRIPSHWRVSRIGYACDLLTGFPFESAGFTMSSNETPLLRGTNVGVDQVEWADVVYWPSSDAPQFSRYQLAVGDIVMGLDRPFIGAGIRVARIGPNDVPSLLLQRVARIRSTRSFAQDYLFLLLSGPGIVHHLTPMFTGVSVPHVSPSQVESLPIPEPPFDEQHQIVKCVTDKCLKVDRLIATAGEAVTTLKEYRAALITDAVTGKIDVRGAA